MTGKHTLGPWVVSETNSGEIADAKGFWIARVILPRTDVGSANARLIAAAPDLLEALMDAVDAWETHCKSGDDMQGYWASDARAAIAKARGQE